MLEDCRAEIARRTLPEFANRPENLRFATPRTILNPRRITMGDHVTLGPNCFLLALERYPGPSLQHPESPVPVQEFEPRIIIGHRVTATAGLQVGACREIEIEDDVMFATNVNITDNFHGYPDASRPYKYQPLWKVAPVKIGRGCWIGQNVVIGPGVTVGELCIIGANSVVLKSVPPRSIAVGAPARVIRQWDDDAVDWRGKGPEESS
jgi:acetyltransferase-like isoleucine patch superfamily enzyme